MDSALRKAASADMSVWQLDLTWVAGMYTLLLTLKCIQGGVPAQVIAYSQGQRREEDLLRALVDAVAAARTEAGTLGQELPGIISCRAPSSCDLHCCHVHVHVHHPACLPICVAPHALSSRDIPLTCRFFGLTKFTT